MNASSGRFADKGVIVTGAAGGIGLATAIQLGSEGASVLLADIDGARAALAVRQVLSAGAPKALGFACDVGEEAQVIACVELCEAAFGRVDVVVNNAGLMVFKPLEQHTAEDFASVLRVDLLGAFFFVKHAFLRMKGSGAIVNVSSVHAEQTTPLVAAYAAAKAGLLSLTRSAAIEGKAKGIRVNAVLPGAIETPMLRENPNITSGVEQLDPSDVGLPEDIARAIAYLASEDARFVHGALLRVDGGRLDRL